MDQTPTQAPNPLALLLELGEAFHSATDVDGLLATILARLQTSIGSEGGSIWQLDEARNQLRCTHALGADRDKVLGHSLSAQDFRKMYQVDGRVIKLDRIAPQSTTTSLFLRGLFPTAHNVISAPLINRGQTFGLINLVDKRGAPAFSNDDRDLLAALASHASVAILNAWLAEQQRRNAERQQLLDQISRYLQQTLDLGVLIQRIFEEVNQAIQAEAQSIWLVNHEAGVITCRFSTGPGSPEILKVSVPIGKGIVGATVEKQEPVLIADAQKDERLFRGADAKTGLITRSLMSVPMVREGQSIGAIQAINKRDGALFTLGDLQLFQSIASSAALSIENARLYTDLQATYDNTLEALTRALDLRDRETEGHSRRVVEYTARLAQQIGLDRKQIIEIRRGALIHDIGKIGVPDRILHKPGGLDPDERKEIEKHPQNGYEMLLGIPYLLEEVKIVLAHQEKWDGSGYPLGLKGEAIPLGARLFAISDTFDALTSDRPYRKGRPYEAARQIIEDEAGKQFDPAAVQAFLAVPPEEWEQIRSLVMEEVHRRRQVHEERVRRGKTGMLRLPDNYQAPDAH